MPKTLQAKFGEGIFLTKDVSEILHLPYPTVRRWMLELWDKKFVNSVGSAFGGKGNKAINFYTLIEFFTFFHLREQKVPWKKIFEARSTIANDLGTTYPFATRLRTDGKSIWYETLGHLVKADGRQQFDLKIILEPFLKRIDFDADLLAERYYPLKDSKSIVVDPNHQFGQPTIAGTNIMAEVIYKLYNGGETTENICNLYDISENQVDAAILYHKQIA
jgi:uncharacterized protein (DUF433 family)